MSLVFLFFQGLCVGVGSSQMRMRHWGTRKGGRPEVGVPSGTRLLASSGPNPVCEKEPHFPASGLSGMGRSSQPRVPPHRQLTTCLGFDGHAASALAIHLRSCLKAARDGMPTSVHASVPRNIYKQVALLGWSGPLADRVGKVKCA